MHRRSSSLVAGALAVAGSLAVSAGASAAVVKGTVVHQNHRAHSFVVADARGHLTALHAGRAPQTGRTVSVTARKLRNGTYAALRVQVGRKARRARVQGTVTYVNRRSRSFVVSARGVSLLVRQPGRARPRGAHVAAALPGVGTVVTVNAALDGRGTVVAQAVADDGRDTGTIALEGMVVSVDAATHTLTLSADDDGQANATVTVSLPDTFDVSTYAAGDEIELVATLNADGTYTAVGSSDDENAQQADDQGDDQGDDAAGDQTDGQGDQTDGQGDQSDQPQGSSSSDVAQRDGSGDGRHASGHGSDD